MQPKPEFSKITKGMIFAGCSFTWGQGLYYYSNLETLTEPGDPWGYDSGCYTMIHHRHKESLRYPRKVANYFKTFELVQPNNGGSNEQIVRYWSACFKGIEGGNKVQSSSPGHFDEVEQIHYNEISCVVFQLTQWMRDHFVIEYDDEFINIPLQWYWDNHRGRPHRDIFEKYLEDNNISHHDFNNKIQNKSLRRVKRFLMECEENGVKTYILTWPKEWFRFIESDPWLSERFISLEYLGKNYNSIEELMDNNEGMEIRKDYDKFDIPPLDCHPSLRCHEIIAGNIIKFIKEKENG